MNLRGSLARLQKSSARFYLVLAQLFESNQLIREIWLALAQDMEQQAESLKTLPPLFWRKLGEQKKEVISAIRSCVGMEAARFQEDRSLHHCFTHALDIEEALVLKAYVPLVRHLRATRFDSTLDFYIMMKAHMARLPRIIQAFSGDPALVQRVLNLQLRFEEQVQSPWEDMLPPIAAKRKKSAARIPSDASLVRKSRRKPVSSRSGERPLPVGKPGRGLRKQAKSLTAKIEMIPRRARR
jgi:hypothetical protein